MEWITIFITFITITHTTFITRYIVTNEMDRIFIKLLFIDN
jgi:hypothetical protein